MRRGAGEPEHFVIRCTEVLPQRKEIVLDPREIQYAYLMPSGFESARHLQQPQPNKDTLVKQEAAGRLDQTDAHFCISASTGLTAKLSIGLRRIGSDSSRSRGSVSPRWYVALSLRASLPGTLSSSGERNAWCM